MIHAVRRSPSPESHRLWNNRRAIWFHAPRPRGAAYDTAGRLRSAALIYIRGPDVRVLRGKWVRSASDPMKKTGKTKSGGDGTRTGKAVGDALREAYDEAIGEAIPDEMLDLLKKLD